MKCPRCGKRNSGASWYCSNCGASLTDLNVADPGGGSRLRPLARWGLLAAVGLLLFVAAAAVAGSTLLDGSRAAGGGALSGAFVTPSATVVQRPSTTPLPRIVTPVPTARSRPGIAPWRASLLTSAPVIDGVLDEWQGEPRPLSIIVSGEENWSGPDDASGRASVAWDDRALYVAVHVVDDDIVVESAERPVEGGDALDLRLDVDLAGDWSTDTYNGDDWQIALYPGDLGDREPAAYIRRPVQQAAGGIEVASRVVPGGYVVESAIPWPLLGFNPSLNDGLGATLSIIDVDRDGAKDETGPRAGETSTPNKDSGQSLGAATGEQTPLTVVSISQLWSESDPRTMATLFLVR